MLPPWPAGERARGVREGGHHLRVPGKDWTDCLTVRACGLAACVVWRILVVTQRRRIGPLPAAGGLVGRAQHWHLTAVHIPHPKIWAGLPFLAPAGLYQLPPHGPHGEGCLIPQGWGLTARAGMGSGAARMHRCRLQTRPLPVSQPWGAACERIGSAAPPPPPPPTNPRSPRSTTHPSVGTTAAGAPAGGPPPCCRSWVWRPCSTSGRRRAGSRPLPVVQPLRLPLASAQADSPSSRIA